MSSSERFQTIVIGGGQAGLAAAYFLSKAGHDYIILDAGPAFGTTWRMRWDSLRLFTPAKFSSLPGMQFPPGGFSFPSKDEVAAYLQAYAREFNPPVHFGTAVESLTRGDGGFVLATRERSYSATCVIVATGAYQDPYVPGFATQLDPNVVQIHSCTYRNPGQLPDGSILVVGAGNSGAEIAVELAKAGRRVWLSGRDVGRIPADVVGKRLGGWPYWWFISRALSVHTPVGRRVQQASLSQGTPLIGLRPEAVVGAGVTRVARVRGVSEGKPELADGQVLDVSGVVWATGFRPNFRWVQLPIFDKSGYPRHYRGLVPEVEGLYFLGLPFQTSLSSSLLGGVGADAHYISRHLSSKLSLRSATLN
jgi:putative flavoprotein involved in K+ transport